MTEAFIIGNGPSLAKTNLDLLIGRPSFACNNIELIFPKTKWRPTHYVRSEDITLPEGAPIDRWESSMEAILDCGAEIHLSGYYLNHWPELRDEAHEIKHCHHHQYNFDDPKCPTEWHMPQPCQMGGSLITAMQIAIRKGFWPIVLVGCDLNYRDNKPSHFDPGYEHGYEQPAFYANHNNLRGFLNGINYYARRNMPFDVINATIGGDLHLFPRKSLEEICATG